MDSIPSTVLAVVQLHLKALLYWFNDEMMRQLLVRHQDHFLVCLSKMLDFRLLEKACADYHHQSGPGAPPTHTVSRLVRALLVKYLYDLSLRQLEQSIQWDLLTKWFVGYALFEAGPDHATLARFEEWVIEQQQRTFFDEVLKQIDQAFPEERKKPQMGDTYAMRANAASESLTGLLRHACRLLLNTLGQADENALAQIKDQLDLAALFGAEDETKEFRLDRSLRKERLQQTAIAAAHCLEQVQRYLANTPQIAAADRQTVTHWLDILDKILTDEVTIHRNQEGRITSAQELPKKQKGSYRIASAADTDATFRVHDDQIDFGFNVNVAATDTFIREIRADTGAQPDPVAIPDLITTQQEHHDLTPEKFIYDKAAGTGKCHADVDKATNGQTQLVAPLVDHNKQRERFGPDDFILAPDGDSLTCPNGETSRTAYRSQSAQGRNFRFSAQQCADCPLAQLCRSHKLAPDRMRQVFITDHRSALAKARTYAQTDAFQEDLKLRSTIERIIANLTRYHGARDARRRGLLKADFQAKMSATAFNIRQWIRRFDRQPLVTDL
jgi:IS5 family transposase